jgi:hypothetical protein
MSDNNVPTTETAGWAIDMSTGRPILTYDGCSVIEAEQAEQVMALVAGPTDTKPLSPPACVGDDCGKRPCGNACAVYDCPGAPDSPSPTDAAVREAAKAMRKTVGFHAEYCMCAECLAARRFDAALAECEEVK